MIGSHNSMSYLPIVNWWQKWQKRWCCCQSKTIQEQYNAGIRFFDIRVKFIDNYWHFVHNKVDFGVIDTLVFDFLNRQSEPVYIRFILDERSNPKDSNYTKKYYIFIASLLSNYTNIIPYEILTAWDWKNHIDIIYDNNPPKCKIKYMEEMHASVSNNLVDYILYGTKICRPLMSPEEVIKYNSALQEENKVLLLDFI